MKRAALLILFGLLLVGCTTTTPAADPAPVADAAPATATTGAVASTGPTAISEPAASAEPTTVVEPTEAPATATSAPAGTSPASMNGRNDDGTFYRGSPDAPVTIVEYSDFL